MEDDLLKKYIATNRSAFDTQKLPEGMFGRIQIDLKKRKKRKKQRSIFRYLAAASIVALTSLIFVFNNQDQPTIDQQLVKDQSKGKQIMPINLDSIERLQDQEKIVHYENSRREIDKGPLGKNNVQSNTNFNVRKNESKASSNIPSETQLLAALYDTESVGNRLTAVLQIKEKPTLNQQMKNTLCDVFLTDENENVRLAILDILANYSHEKPVLEVFGTALSNGEDPFVQIELAKMLSTSNDPIIKEKLEKLLWNEQLMESVREEVYLAMARGNKNNHHFND